MARSAASIWSSRLSSAAFAHLIASSPLRRELFLQPAACVHHPPLQRAARDAEHRRHLLVGAVARSRGASADREASPAAPAPAPRPCARAPDPPAGPRCPAPGSTGSRYASSSVLVIRRMRRHNDSRLVSACRHAIASSQVLNCASPRKPSSLFHADTSASCATSSASSRDRQTIRAVRTTAAWWRRPAPRTRQCPPGGPARRAPRPSHGI